MNPTMDRDRRKSVSGSRDAGEVRNPSESPAKIPQKVVRILFTDVDATDSSSEDEGEIVRRRVKRRVQKIDIRAPANVRRVAQGKGREPDSSRRNKFGEVRRRSRGRWAAEIRDPARRKRLQLEAHDTAEEEATVYDNAAVTLKGPDTVTNFTESVKTETFPKCEVPKISSPTSVLPDGDPMPLDIFHYGDIDALGFDVESPLTLTMTDVSSRTYFREFEEFGDFDAADFSLEIVSF